MANEKDRSENDAMPRTQGSETPVTAEKAQVSTVKQGSSVIPGKADRASKGDEKAKGEKGDPEVRPDAVDDDDPFDFGGLPNRNLKKNLGCG